MTSQMLQLKFNLTAFQPVPESSLRYYFYNRIKSLFCLHTHKYQVIVVLTTTGNSKRRFDVNINDTLRHTAKGNSKSVWDNANRFNRFSTVRNSGCHPWCMMKWTPEEKVKTCVLWNSRVWNGNVTLRVQVRTSALFYLNSATETNTVYIWGLRCFTVYIKLFVFDGVYPLCGSVHVVGVCENGKPNLGGLKAPITIHFIEPSSLPFSTLFLPGLISAHVFHLLLSHRLFLHHISTSFNTFTPFSLPFFLLLSPFLSSALIYSNFSNLLAPKCSSLLFTLSFSLPHAEDSKVESVLCCMHNFKMPQNFRCVFSAFHL